MLPLRNEAENTSCDCACFSQLIFDYSSTGSLGVLLESAVASSAPTESAFLLGFSILEECSLKLVGKKKFHVPVMEGTGQTSQIPPSSGLKQLGSEVDI